MPWSSWIINTRAYSRSNLLLLHKKNFQNVRKFIKNVRSLRPKMCRRKNVNYWNMLSFSWCCNAWFDRLGAFWISLIFSCFFLVSNVTYNSCWQWTTHELFAKSVAHCQHLLQTTHISLFLGKNSQIWVQHHQKNSIFTLF